MRLPWIPYIIVVLYLTSRRVQFIFDKLTQTFTYYILYENTLYHKGLARRILIIQSYMYNPKSKQTESKKKSNKKIQNKTLLTRNDEMRPSLQMQKDKTYSASLKMPVN